MVNGILYWPFINALNFKFVRLEVNKQQTCTAFRNEKPSSHPSMATKASIDSSLSYNIT